MTRVALLLPAILLSGCIGVARYAVKPYYEPNTKTVICCEAIAENGKDIASLTFDLSEAPDKTITVHFSESGVSATAPIAANAVTASAVSTAISNVAVTAAKFSLKP